MSSLQTTTDQKSDGMRGFDFGQPLLCPPVLQCIFNDLDLDDLKICRLVCQRWNSISLLQMKSNSMNPNVRISLTDEDRLKEYLNHQTGFSEFQRFKFTFSDDSEPILRQFLNQFQNQLKDVTFIVGISYNCVGTNNNLIDKLLSLLAQNSANFQEFGLEINRESFPLPPSLPFESYDVNWSKLKSLSISSVVVFPSQIFIPILEKSSKLEKLVIQNGVRYSKYRPLLENLVDTLKELHLPGGPGVGDPLYNQTVDGVLPRFTKLKRLKIGPLTDEYNSRLFHPRHIITILALPELFVLSVNDIQHINFASEAVYPKLTFVNLERHASERNFHTFPNIFPNLKKLHIGDGMHCVWNYNMRTIEELKMNGLIQSDRGFIGFDVDLSAYGENHLNKRATNSSTVHKYNYRFADLFAGNELGQRDNEKEFVEWSTIYNAHKRTMDTYAQPYENGIHDLTELRRLSIWVHQISNLSIIFGILKCKSLRSIRLLGPSTYLTKEILVWMADDLNLMNLSIDVSAANRDWISSEEAIYFRKKLPHCQLVFPYYPTNSATLTHRKRWIF